MNLALFCVPCCLCYHLSVGSRTPYFSSPNLQCCEWNQGPWACTLDYWTLLISLFFLQNTGLLYLAQASFILIIFLSQLPKFLGLRIGAWHHARLKLVSNLLCTWSVSLSSGRGNLRTHWVLFPASLLENC